MKGFTSVVICLVLSACTADKNVSRSFYYWDKEFHLSDEDRTLLEGLNNERIYLRCFTLEWDKPTKKIRNIDEVRLLGSWPAALEFVPVIHVKQDFFHFIKPEQIPFIANAMLNKVDSLAKKANFSFSELQIDFKWSEQSRELYFALLGSLKAALDPVEQKLSCSIRLQQLQFPDVTGVPPVDRGMLLFYNTGKLNEPGTRNSIYDPDVAARYVSYVKSYQLPLDIALPVFTWGVHQRNGEVLSVIQNITLSDVRKSGLFIEKAKGLFSPLMACDFKGSWFKEGDRLRVEEISPNNSLRAARQVQPFLSDKQIHVALFCLDSMNTSRYKREDFDELYSVFE